MYNYKSNIFKTTIKKGGHVTITNGELIGFDNYIHVGRIQKRIYIYVGRIQNLPITRTNKISRGYKAVIFIKDLLIILKVVILNCQFLAIILIKSFICQEVLTELKKKNGV